MLGVGYADAASERAHLRQWCQHRLGDRSAEADNNVPAPAAVFWLSLMICTAGVKRKLDRSNRDRSFCFVVHCNKSGSSEKRERGGGAGENVDSTAKGVNNKNE